MGVSFPGKKRYEGARFNVISVTRGWVGVKYPGKKHCVTIERPLCYDYVATDQGRKKSCTMVDQTMVVPPTEQLGYTYLWHKYT